MSTRGCIARVEGDFWRGIYQHWDSYPTRLGKTIWERLHDGYQGNISQLLEDAIDKHPGGWSSYPDRCYCHWKGRENDGPMVMTDQDCDPLFIEWVYALDPDSKVMSIFTNASVPKLKGGQHGTLIEASTIQRLDGTVEKTPAHYYVHKLVASVRLDGDEPDWETIEKTN